MYDQLTKVFGQSQFYSVKATFYHFLAPPLMHIYSIEDMDNNSIHFLYNIFIHESA